MNSRTLTLDEVLARIRALQSAGQVDAATALARQVTQQAPTLAVGWQHLGMLMLATGHAAEAVQAWTEAARLAPDDAGSQVNLGLAHRQAGDNAAATGAFERALQLRPDYPLASYQLANLHFSSGDRAAAAAIIGQLTLQHPEFGYGHLLAGEISLEAGDTAMALAAYQQARRQLPDHAGAAAGFARAAFDVYAVVEGLAAIEFALAKEPQRADWLTLRGSLNFAANRPEAAEADYRAALALDPKPEAHDNLGVALSAQGRWPEAAEAFAQAAPTLASARSNLAEAHHHLCIWDTLDADHRAVLATLEVPPEKTGIKPFFSLMVPTSPAQQLEFARRYIAREYGAPPTPLCIGLPEERRQRRRLRIGYLSYDFRSHATAHLMSEVLELHDRAQFEIHAYSAGPNDAGSERERIRAAVDHWHDVARISDLALARQILADEIDVLVELGGHTKGTRLGTLAWRPAPVQLHFLGYPGTLGAPWIDYLVADPIVVPAGEDAHYAEAIIRMPHCYQANDRRRPRPAPAPRSELGLPDDALVFACFNQAQKLQPACFERWMNILKAVPDAILWLLKTNPGAESSLLREAAAAGLDPARLVFAPALPMPAHLARLAAADLVLDTLPYNAHTTGSDALWMGVPVLTCRGQTFAGRVGASLVTAVGLPELVTENLDDYQRLAIELAQDRPRLRALQEHLRANAVHSPLFDTPRFVAALETAYQQAWSRAARGLPPAAIDLAAADRAASAPTV